MGWVTIPGVMGKVYEPEAPDPESRKHNCPDCYECQHCSDMRCTQCLHRARAACKRKGCCKKRRRA